jgi:RNA polymerase sigma-70 factor (ECF subfamily)
VLPLEDEAVDSLVASGASPEARALSRQSLRLALSLLDRLKPAKRVAFVLVSIDGLSLEEAACVVGAKVPAVKQRVLAARRELKSMLDRREGKR